jgi:branched-chain amino acid transport system permease protein
MLAGKYLRRAIDAAICIGAVVALFAASPFTLFQFGMACCLGIAVLGLKLLSGYNGQYSLGHSVFLAIGAYTTAILVDAGMSFYVTLPAAAAVAFGFGLALGWPALRIRGQALAVVTLVLALAAPQIARSTLLERLTGGPSGIALPQLHSPVGWLSDGQWWFLLVVSIAAAIWLVAAGIIRSRFGRAMQASRDNETAARASGINIALVNTISFGISAAYAGIAGGMTMGTLRYVGPETFELITGLGLFLALVVTGPHWLGAAFLGGLFLQFLPNWAEDLTTEMGLVGSFTWAIYGVVLLIIVYAQIIDWRRDKSSLRLPSTNAGAAPLSGHSDA